MVKKIVERLIKGIKSLWIIPLVIILAIVSDTYGYFFIAFAIFLLGFMFVRLWRKRAILKDAMRYIETAMFGKPLEKDLWKKGEMNKTKVKLVWGDKKRKPKKKKSS